MKSNLMITGVVILAGMLSCKKGEEDPFLSLASRKARISGEWEMTAYEKEWFSRSDSDTISSGTESGDGMKVVRNWTFYDQDHTVEMTILEYSYTINRDGTWSSVIDQEGLQTVEDPYTISTTPFAARYEKSGTWAFVNKTKDVYKNKERVDFSVLTESTSWPAAVTTTTYKDSGLTGTEDHPAYSNSNTYATGQNVITYDLLMLKSKQMKWVKVSESHSAQMDGSLSYHSGSGSSESITWDLK